MKARRIERKKMVKRDKKNPEDKDTGGLIPMNE
jgi:hypothetical protein